MRPSFPSLKGHSPPIFCQCPLWPNGWMDEDATWYGSRLRSRLHCAKWDPAPLSKKGAHPPPIFGPFLHGRPSQLLLSSCTNGRPKTITITTALLYLGLSTRCNRSTQSFAITTASCMSAAGQALQQPCLQRSQERSNDDGCTVYSPFMEDGRVKRCHISSGA